MTLTIGKYITIYYEPATEITEAYWHMTLNEPDGTINRFWTSKDLGELLRIARGGSSLFARR